MADPRIGKSIEVGTLIAEHTFEDFESLSLIDAGATDGFTLEDIDGNTAVIPTGVPISIGGPGPKASSFLTVKPTGSTTLNCSYILYR